MRPACTATTHASGRAGGRLNDLTVKRESQSEDGGQMLFGLLIVGFIIFYCVVNRGSSKTISYDTRQLDV